jgi:N-methylhydantoinase B
LTVDLVTTEIIRSAQIYAAEEMGIALRNSAYSPNIKERLDFSCALFDSKKRLTAQAEHIPVHLGSLNWAIKEGLGHFNGDLHSGDIILLNDPYLSGTHLPDITLIAPIFYKEEIIGYAANKAHHSDIGGRVPGSMAANSTELYQEGLIVPPIKLVKRGKIDKEISSLLMANVRTPEMQMGDLQAQVAANILGSRRMKGLAQEYGLEKLNEAIEQIMKNSEKLTLAAIAKMPEGIYEAEDYLESTGVSDQPVKLKVSITVFDDSLVFDYTGTSPQVEGPVNAVFGVTLSGVYYVVRCVTGPEIPMNEGCLTPIKVHAPPGCILNPIRPAPIAGGNVETSQRNADVLLKAFSAILPEKALAASQGTMNNIAVGGLNLETCNAWTYYETIAGGWGGRNGLDGVDAIHTHMTNSMNTPIEVLETLYPIRFLKYEMRIDSGGPGKWRGGVGLERSWRLLSSSATLSVLAERTLIAPSGIFGGREGMKGKFVILKADGREIQLKSKCTIRLEQGDVFVARTPGGGGYGNPFERDPKAVLRDVVNGLVSHESAKQEYGVVIDQGFEDIDWEATKNLRAAVSLNQPSSKEGAS